MKNKAPPVHVIQLLATVEHWRMLKALFFFSEMEEKKNGKTKQKCYRRNLLPSLFIYE